MASQTEWLILDVFHNVRGPYTAEEIRRRVKLGPNFFVFQDARQEWSPVDGVPELAGGEGGGQPMPQAWAEHAAQRLEQAIAELMGICKGIVGDGKVDPNEAVYLKSWLGDHQEVAGTWPANVLSERIAKIFEDGVVDKQEQEELAELLLKITGEKPGLADAVQLAKSVAVDQPEPRLEFEGKVFCLTGKFAYGSREKCEGEIKSRGGFCKNFPDLETDYLVIGALGSKDWHELSHGRKIEFVVKNPQARSRTAIVSEENWSYHL